jgi:hypothetical protein
MPCRVSERKVNIPDHVRRILEDARAPTREAENDERTQRIRGRAAEATVDARECKGFVGQDSGAWWRSPVPTDPGSDGREVTEKEPLRVLVAGGGLAGLVTAAACHAKGMKVEERCRCPALRALDSNTKREAEEGGIGLCVLRVGRALEAAEGVLTERGSMMKQDDGMRAEASRLIF